MKITVATCYLPVDADIRRNRQYVSRQMDTAKERGAHVAHFPEACLSGYAGSDFASYEGFDWRLLEECMQQVLDLARQLRLWVILGSTHRLTGRHKPHNSVYIINDHGELVDRYDKMFCSGDRYGRTGDLSHYSPGSHFSVFTIRGVRCGALICYDFRFPELYREYKSRGVQLMFHSFHAGHVSPKRMKELRAYIGNEFIQLSGAPTIPGITMPATMVSSAANNYMWISCSNTSARESCWPSFLVRPDGITAGRLRLNTPGVLISEVDTRAPLYDATVAWRDQAMRGIFHSGTVVRDKRSDERRRP